MYVIYTILVDSRIVVVKCVLFCLCLIVKYCLVHVYLAIIAHCYENT